jgi:protein phosphatase 1 regulatory subunit 37
MDALRTVKYMHAKSIRLWKTGCQDEGVRSICQYLQINPNVLILELLDNEITPLGCEFLSRVLHPSAKLNLSILKLDHNPFGSAGVEHLCKGMLQNQTITQISLTYCNIDAAGARPLFEMLIYQKSLLEELNLSGNSLRNEGVIQVLKGVSVAKNLKKIYLADNQFSEEANVLDAIGKCFNKNQNLGRYDFRYNFLTDDGVLKICEFLETANHVYEVEIPERISKDTLDLYKERMANNKPKKGKKAGKKKKKK